MRQGLDKRKQELHEQTLVMMVEKVSLTRDRDALGAAVGVRTIPAPHATLVSERTERLRRLPWCIA